METVVERPAALDVHKEQVTACVRVPGGGRAARAACGGVQDDGAGAARAARLVEAHGVTQVAMEATGVYWKPPWAILEDEFECLLVNARHVKQVPGRKTDVSDAAWLCQLLEAGLLSASFVPPKPIRTLRQPDPLPQGADRRAPAGGQPAAQDPRGHRDQARLRRHRHPRRLRPGDARRARRRHDRPGGARRAGQGQAAPEAAGAAGGARGPLRRRARAIVVGAILAHIDFLDEQIEPALGRDRGADPPFRGGG